MQWKKDLNILRNVYMFDVAFDKIDRFKEKYPGNYTLKPIYDSKRMVYAYKLIFDDPLEETFWILKYSG